MYFQGYVNIPMDIRYIWTRHASMDTLYLHIYIYICRDVNIFKERQEQLQLTWDHMHYKR